MTDPHGLDVIDHATALITHAVLQGAQIHIDRHTNPAAHPDYGPDTTMRSIARRAVAALMHAGLLVEPLTPDELEQMRRHNTRGGT